MKTRYLVSISLLGLLTMLFVVSCEKQDNPPKSTENSYEELYKKANESGIKIEHLTLSELNKIFIENGLEPYSEEYVSEYIQPYLESRGYNCNDYNFIAYCGDADHNGSLSGYDLVLIQQNYLVLGTEVSGHGKAIYPTNPATDPDIYNQGLMSVPYLASLGQYEEPFMLDFHDKDAGAWAILGYACP